MQSKSSYCTIPKTSTFTDVTSITYNGVNFIFLDSDKGSIILLDEKFNLLKNIQLKRKYSNICFDISHNCYWAISNNNCYIIYKLDSSFNEINKMYIKNALDYKTTGISYNCSEKKMWISFSNYIGYIKDGSDELICVENIRKTMVNGSILSFLPGTLVSYKEDSRQFIEIYENRCSIDLAECIPDEYTIEDFCLISCNKYKNGYLSLYKICLLLSQNCSKKLFVMSCYLKVCKNQQPKLICENIKCNTNSKKINSSCHKISNRRIEFPSGSKTCCRDAKYQIMQSIALEEAGIAHILNAEGEKIQKAVANFTDIDKLICVNESVRQTIIQITQLETQLYLKLEVLQNNDCDNECCEDYCKIKSCCKDY